MFFDQNGYTVKLILEAFILFMLDALYEHYFNMPTRFKRLQRQRKLSGA